MKRQIETQGIICLWEHTTLDIDPFVLPAHYHLVRNAPMSPLYQSHDQIVLGRRSVLMKHYIYSQLYKYQRLCLKEFEGVAIRVGVIDALQNRFKISINLHHREQKYCIPLHFAYDLDMSIARVQTWSRILKLPVLMPALDGTWQKVFNIPKHFNIDSAYMRHPRQYLEGRKAILPAYRAIGSADTKRIIIQGREMIAPE
ncbi:MAG: DUF6101 family protein [Pseudomonadota bacterium]